MGKFGSKLCWKYCIWFQWSSTLPFLYSTTLDKPLTENFQTSGAFSKVASSLSHTSCTLLIWDQGPNTWRSFTLVICLEWFYDQLGGTCQRPFLSLSKGYKKKLGSFKSLISHGKWVSKPPWLCSMLIFRDVIHPQKKAVTSRSSQKGTFSTEKFKLLLVTVASPWKYLVLCKAFPGTSTSSRGQCPRPTRNPLPLMKLQGISEKKNGHV